MIHNTTHHAQFCSTKVRFVTLYWVVHNNLTVKHTVQTAKNISVIGKMIISQERTNRDPQII